jgi:hypothetical protein
MHRFVLHRVRDDPTGVQRIRSAAPSVKLAGGRMRDHVSVAKGTAGRAGSCFRPFVKDEASDKDGAALASQRRLVQIR